jgi:hypothetical protein
MDLVNKGQIVVDKKDLNSHAKMGYLEHTYY